MSEFSDNEVWLADIRDSLSRLDAKAELKRLGGADSFIALRSSKLEHSILSESFDSLFWRHSSVTACLGSPISILGLV